MRSRSLRSSLLRSMILGFLILDNTVQMANGASRHRVARRIHLPRAVNAARRFACKEPQSRAYNLNDLVPKEVLKNPGESAVQPVYVVLKRCDSHSGCCMSLDMACLPVESYYEEIEIEIWSVGTNSTRRQWIEVEQHSMCVCNFTMSSDRRDLDEQHPKVNFT